MRKRVVIVGAGPGGLASAMLLANAGLDVTVLEKRDRVGGRTSSFTQPSPHGEFTFDLGPTFFLYPGILEEIFKHCGMDLYDRIELRKLDPQYHLIFEGGGDVRATPDLPRLQAELSKIDPEDARNVRRYLDDNRKKFAAFRSILQRPFASPRDLLAMDTLRSLPLLRPFSSVDSDLKRYFKDERTRLAFSFQAKYLGMSPFQCPSLFTILSFLEYEYGVYHPVGGCGAVSEAMADAARELGVTIRLNEAVTRVNVERGRAVGVDTIGHGPSCTCGAADAATYPCDALVINADFAHAMQHLVDDRHRRRWTDTKLETKKYSCSTYMLYLGIEGRYDALEHHTIFLSKDYKRNLREIEDDHVLSDEPSVYVQNASVSDDSLAPDGMSTLYILAPVTHRTSGVDWGAQREAFRRTVLKQVAKIGLGNIEERIVVERELTPAEWETDLSIFRGATFNLAHNLGQMLHRRPQNRFEDIDGVYLVGGGTHPGSGLPVIYEGARISSRLLLQDLGVEADLPVAMPPPERQEAPTRAVRAPAAVGT